MTVDFYEYRAHHWHETLDLQIRLQGAEKAIRAMRGGIFPRANSNGLLTAEIQQIVARLTSMSGWYQSWAKDASARAELGRDALRQSRKITAREALLQATYLYFYGQLYAKFGHPEKREGSLRMIECYSQAGALLEPPAERVEIPFRETILPGYLRIPGGPEKKPGLIMLGGADTVKEECHHWSEHFLARGVATLAVDGPGQGESHATLPMSADYEKAVSTIREWLSNRPAIDRRRIGVWGCSTGGYLAARCLAFDPQLSLGVSVGGFYDARLFPDWPPPTQEAFQRLFWLENLSQTVQYVQKNVTLKPLMRRIERPFLIVHGVRDHLVPKAEIQEMVDEAPDKAELWAYEDGTHSVWNKLDLAAPRTADWVAEHL